MSRPIDPPTATLNKPKRQLGWPTFGLSALVIFGITVYLLARDMWPSVLYRLFTDGGIALIWLLAAVGIGSTLLRIARIHCDSKSLLFATAGAIGLGVLSIIILLLGLAGWMNRPVAIGLIAAGILIGIVAENFKSSDQKFQIPSFKSENWFWLIVAPIAAMVIVAALEPPGLLWGDEPNGYDVLEYHFQVPREWIELGRIAPLHHNVFSYFPFNVEMHYLLAMDLRGGPWAGMYLAQLMHVIFIVLTIISLIGIAKPPAAMVAACVPWMAMLAPVGYDEGGFLLFSTLAVGWMLAADGQLRNVILAGALAGFACGTKLTAVPMVLLAIPATTLLIVPKIPTLKSAAIFVLTGLLTFSPWMIRNTIWTGNPVFPEVMSLLGRDGLSDVQVERWHRAHSIAAAEIGSLSRISAPWIQLEGNWRYGFVLLPLMLIAFALSRSRQSFFLLLLILIQFCFWIAFTHLQGRFFILAIPIGAILLGQVDFRYWRIMLATAAAISAAIGMFVLVPRVSQFTIGIGVENLQGLLSEKINAALESDKPIALAGDARAFLYQIPMSRLHYRTVFDVDVQSGESIVGAWIKGAPADATIIIDPSELERFSRTYWKIPPLENPANDPALKDCTWLTAP